MKLTLSIATAGAGLLFMGLPIAAHHSFAAEYDFTKKIELKGVVTKFEWTNPHAHFYIDVTDKNGKVANWNLELASPNMMQRNGWTRHSLKEATWSWLSRPRPKTAPPAPTRSGNRMARS